MAARDVWFQAFQPALMILWPEEGSRRDYFLTGGRYTAASPQPDYYAIIFRHFLRQSGFFLRYHAATILQPSFTGHADNTPATPRYACAGRHCRIPATPDILLYLLTASFFNTAILFIGIFSSLFHDSSLY